MYAVYNPQITANTNNNIKIIFLIFLRKDLRFISVGSVHYNARTIILIDWIATLSLAMTNFSYKKRALRLF